MTELLSGQRKGGTVTQYQAIESWLGLKHAPDPTTGRTPHLVNDHR